MNVLLQNYATENLNQLRRVTPTDSVTLSLYLPLFDAHSYVHKYAHGSFIAAHDLVCCHVGCVIIVVTVIHGSRVYCTCSMAVGCGRERISER